MPKLFPSIIPERHEDDDAKDSIMKTPGAYDDDDTDGDDNDGE